MVLVVAFFPPEQGGHHLFQNGERGEHDSTEDYEPRDRCQPRQKAVERVLVQQDSNQDIQTDEQEVGETDEDQGLLVYADGDQEVLLVLVPARVRWERFATNCIIARVLFCVKDFVSVLLRRASTHPCGHTKTHLTYEVFFGLKTTLLLGMFF